MQHTMDASRLIITRTEGDRQRYYNESQLLYAIKTHLNAHGFDLVKRTTEKDGHMLGDSTTYYLRDRKWRFCFYDDSYMLRYMFEDWNQYGDVVLTRHDLS